MRQRKLKDLDERMEKHAGRFIENPEEYKGKWKEFLKIKGDLFLEFGCGKGQFVKSLAEENRENYYLAIEGQASVAVIAAEKLDEAELENAKVLNIFVKNIEDYFDEDELSGLYLNFSDPWPKARHSKRRLTHRNFLKSYGKIIKSGGFVEFKTDNDGLFEFTLEELRDLEINPIEVSKNLHKTDYKSNRYRTEYEDKFSEKGKNINYVKFEII